MPAPETAISDALIAAAQRLSGEVGTLEFASPVSHCYNPLDYAWAPNELYLRRYGNSRKKIVFRLTLRSVRFPRPPS